jgi:hypothetical protein
MPIKALAAVLRGTSDMVSLGVAHAVLERKDGGGSRRERRMQAMQIGPGSQNYWTKTSPWRRDSVLLPQILMCPWGA